MLLVRSKELRNSNKFNVIARGLWCAVPLLFLPFSALAQDKSPESIGSASTWVSVFMSLLLVIGVVLMLGFIMRRFNVTHTGTSQMKIVASMMAGARERIVVIQVGDEQHLVGITAHNINHLSKLETPLEPEQPGERFKAKFNQILQKQEPSGKED